MTNPIVPSPSLDGVSDEMQDHTEQAAIELVYIKEANQLIGQGMLQLTSALNVTQSALNLLTMIQQLHNQISVTAPSNFPFNFATGLATGSPPSPNTSLPLTTTQYQQNYQLVASAYYGHAISPSFMFASVNSMGFASTLNTMLTVKKSLGAEITSLSAQTSAMQKGNGSLLFSLKTVYDELPTNFSTMKKWALDNYTASAQSAASAGGIENDITTAIVAAQSLNNTQQENARQFLFVFQEYYQSAAAILSSITQIITQMAGNISQ